MGGPVLVIALLYSFPVWGCLLWYVSTEFWDKYGPGAEARRQEKQRCAEQARLVRAERAARDAETRARWRIEQEALEAARRDEYHEARYGERHQAERAKYAAVISQHGGVCMERECIMASRRIEPGAFWHLAHDHELGGPSDYLGPAHPECNEAEARSRGVTWEDDSGSFDQPEWDSADDADLWL